MTFALPISNAGCKIRPGFCPKDGLKVKVHWPKGNVLISRGVCDPECGIPDYNATVEIERVG